MDLKSNEELVRLAPGMKGLLIAGASVFALALSPAMAQTTPDDGVEVIEEDEDEADEGDTVVVTGSRLRRDEFTSISPIQVISGEVSRDLGLVDAAELLRQTSVVQGRQTDLGVSTVVTPTEAFTTFGSVTPSLRGLSSSVTGRSRNLVLVNGRRLGPIGVGGAPANPDVSLIPGSLISRVDLLLDGASSIYGSDAIAGVINYQLRTEFDGLELDAFVDRSKVGDESMTFSATAGFNSDRGYSVVAAEYNRNTGYRRIDRFDEYLPFVETPFGSIACDPEREINRVTGEIFEGCSGGLADFFVFGPTGTTIVTPGQTNIDIPGFSRLGLAPFDGPDSQGTFGSINNPFTRSFPLDQQTYVSPPRDRISIYSIGEYETDLPTNAKFYYELSYGERNLKSNSYAQGVIEVTEDTPFNPGLGSTLLVHPTQFDIEQNVNVFRATAGLTGDLEFMDNLGPLSDWQYDQYVLFHRSRGTQSNFGDVNTTNTQRVLSGTYDENGVFNCALDATQQPSRAGPGGGFNTAIPNCVEVNFFDPVFLTTGRFSNPTHTDFINARAIQTTTVDQVTLNGFISGDLFELPAGAVQAAVGYEYRYDEVQTVNDYNQSTPQALATLNPDVGSSGNRYIAEVFGEVSIPLIEDKPLINSLSIELAGRLITEEFFGEGETYQIKGQWEPVDWLQFSAGFGTSFRAPDTGEQFGTGTVFAVNTRTDPCLPASAVIASDLDDDGLIDYDFAADERRPEVIALCEAIGIVYPQETDSQADIIAKAQALGLFGIGTPSGSFQNFAVLFGNGGNTGITPETSEALFLKLSMDQPWFDGFDLRFSANYFEYDVQDSIGQLTSGVILGACFDPDGDSVVVNGQIQGDLCQFQERDPSSGLLTFVNESSFNLGSLTSRGIDYNLEFGTDLGFVKKLPLLSGLEQTPSLSLILRGTQQFENAEDIEGTGEFDDLLEEFGFPEYQQNITTTLRYGDWSLLHRFFFATRTGDQAPFGGGNVCTPELLDRGLDPSEFDCTEYLILPDVELHDLALSYRKDTWAMRIGMRNVFDEVPVFDTAVPGDAGTGTPFGIGYDANGRNIFFNITKSF